MQSKLFKVLFIMAVCFVTVAAFMAIFGVASSEPKILENALYVFASGIVTVAVSFTIPFFTSTARSAYSLNR